MCVRALRISTHFFHPVFHPPHSGSRIGFSSMPSGPQTGFSSTPFWSLNQFFLHSIVGPNWEPVAVPECRPRLPPGPVSPWAHSLKRFARASTAKNDNKFIHPQLKHLGRKCKIYLEASFLKLFIKKEIQLYFTLRACKGKKRVASSQSDETREVEGRVPTSEVRKNLNIDVSQR